MRLQKTWRLAASCMLSVALLAGCGGSDLGPEPTFTLQLLHISDADGSDTTATATLGSEQDAFFKYLRANHATTPYGQADTPQAQDQRIQNLSTRSDTVLN